MLNLLISVIPSEYNYTAGYWFICRLTKYWDSRIYLDSSFQFWASDRRIFISGDGLLLSVSALARAGGRGAGQDTEGGTRHAPEPDKVEPGGSEQSYNSLGKH